MVEFSEIWDFLLSLLFGAIVVGVHAHSLFAQRLNNPDIEKREDPLATLSLPVILGPSDFRRGFAVYLIANELLYLVLTSSSTILSLLIEVMGNQKMVGALTEDVTPNVLYPVLASSVVVLMSQAKPTSGIERTFRRIAHGVAGMPRNLEDVQKKIRSYILSENATLSQGSVRSTSSLGSGVESELPLDFDKEKILAAAYAKSRGAIRSAKLTITADHDINNFKRSLEKVHCLYAWTLGYDGECIWVSEATRQITTLFKPLELEYLRLSNEIESLVLASSAFSDETHAGKMTSVEKEAEKNRWYTIITSVQSLERRLTVVISLLLINQPDVDLEKYHSLQKMRDSVMERSRGEDAAVSDVTWHTLLLGSVFSIIPLLLLQVSLKLWRGVTNSRASEVLEYPNRLEMGYVSRVLELPKRLWDQPSIWKYAANLVDSALLQLLNYFIIFGCAVAIALLVRRTQKDLMRWPLAFDNRSHIQVAPVSRYLFVGAGAYLITTAIYFLWRFSVHNVIDPMRFGIPIDVQTSIRNFGEYLPGIILEPLTVFPCVWFVLSFVDKKAWKSGSYASAAIKFSIVCALTVLVQKLLRVDFPLTTSVFESVVAPFVGYLCFLVAFARVFELHQEGRNNVSFISRFQDKILVPVGFWRQDKSINKNMRPRAAIGPRRDAVTEKGEVS